MLQFVFIAAPLFTTSELIVGISLCPRGMLKIISEVVGHKFITFEMKLDIRRRFYEGKKLVAVAGTFSENYLERSV